MNVIKISALVLVGGLLFAGCESKQPETASPSQAVIYVSPDGNDSADGTIEAPFATITRARDAARELQALDITVCLRGGTYHIDETIVLGVEDSAPAGGSVTYAAYAGEEPVISSGRQISGWSKLDEKPEALPLKSFGNVYVVDVPEARGGKWNFKTLYSGEKLLPRASSDGFIPTGLCPLPNQKYRWDDLDTLEFPKGELKNWANLEDVEIKILPTHQWLINYLPLASVDEENLVAKTAVPGTYMLGALKEEHWQGYPTCWVENVIDFLDAPGEWALDTQEGKLYLWPESGKPKNIVAPTLRELVKVEGDNTPFADNDKPVTGIMFKGITFTGGDRDVWTNETKGIQHDWDMYDTDNAMLRFRGAENCVVENCTFRNAGASAIRADLYAQNISIRGNTISNVGGTGILFSGYGPGTKDVNKNNEIVNNDISQCGQLWLHSPAIFIWQSGENVARNNKIHDLPYDAIVISGVRPRFYGISDPVKWLPDWPNFKDKHDLRENMKVIRWDEVGQPKNAAEARQYAHARNNVIKDNELFDVMQVLGDGNAIYYSCAGEGNSIERNLVYNSRKAVTEIRFDDDQEESFVTENIIFGNGIKLKHTNYIENNFIIGGQVRIRPETVVGATIERNIIYASEDDAYFYDDKKNFLDLARPDNNLLYCKDEAKGKNLLKKVQDQGYEKNGIFADPMFVDLENGDLTLKPGSPAHKLGIKDIDVDKIGLLDDPAFPRLRKQGFLESVDSSGMLLSQSDGKISYYVSPDGKCCGDGSIDKPFAAITRARDAIRKLRLQGTKNDVTVYLRGGTYRIDETIVFDIRDSAPHGKSVTYAAYKDEEPIITSGQKISGFAKLTEDIASLPEAAKGKVFVADLPETIGGNWRFRTLYNGEEPLPRASSDGFEPTTYCPKPGLKYRWADRNTLHFPEGQLKNWPNLDDIEILIRPTAQWLVNFLPLASVDEEKLEAKTAVLGTYYLGDLGGSHYEGVNSCWVENVIDFLDKPGEWVLDTHKGKLYLWPVDGKAENIYAPKLRELIRVEGVNYTYGNSDLPVTGIHFTGITFTGTDRDVWTTESKGIQHDWDMYDTDNAALRFRGAKDCSVTNCTFRNAGSSAIRADLYAQNISITGNTIRRMGGTGILLSGYGPGTKDVNKNNEIIDNDISKCGELWLHAPAIFIWQSGENIARNNRIHDLPYDAIVISGVRPRYFGIFDPVKWLPEYEDFKDLKDLRENMLTIRWDEVGHPKTAAEARRFAHARNNVIQDNELHDVMQKLGDGNAIYYSCAGEGNAIHRNLIYNSRRAVTEIRFDDDQEESYVTENIVFGNGIKIKHKNYLENNYIIGGQVRIRPETVVGSTVLRNIIYIASNKDFFYDTKNNLLDLARPDYNLLYRKDEEKGAQLLAEIQAAGHEKNGIFAAPMFADLENGDLTLKPGSPAHKLGIKQIDTEKIGLLDDPAFPRLRKRGFRKAVDAAGTIDF